MLFYEHIRALERVAQRPCGVADVGADAYQIVPAASTAFLDALLDALGRTNHAVLLALVEHAAAVALGMKARIRGTWRTPPESVAEHPPPSVPSPPPPCCPGRHRPRARHRPRVSRPGARRGGVPRAGTPDPPARDVLSN